MIRVAIAFAVLAAGCDANLRDWELFDARTFAEIGSEVELGVGADTHVIASLGILAGQHAPENLLVVADDESLIEVEAIGLVYKFADDDWRLEGSREGGVLLRIRPLSAGQNRIRLIADNVDESTELAFEAHEIDQVDLSLAPTLSFDSRPWEPGRPIFAGNTVVATATFSSASGDVMADGPLSFEVPSESMTTWDETPLGDRIIRLDDTSHDIVVTAETTGDVHRIEVLDDTGVADLDIPDADLPGPIELELGRSERIEVFALDAEGRSIVGRPSEVYQLAVSGDAVSIAAEFDYQFSLRAEAVGQAMVTVTWGGASRTVAVDVIDTL